MGNTCNIVWHNCSEALPGCWNELPWSLKVIRKWHNSILWVIISHLRLIEWLDSRKPFTYNTLYTVSIMQIVVECILMFHSNCGYILYRFQYIKCEFFPTHLHFRPHSGYYLPILYKCLYSKKQNDGTTSPRKSLIISLAVSIQYTSVTDTGRRRVAKSDFDKLCGRPPQYSPAPASWPLTFWIWKWCPSHVWRGLPLCQF